ncbi:MAG: PLP-dependent aminotransferase family protein [Christensenellales bacterium]|jgi:2-aminoadipate transaminase
MQAQFSQRMAGVSGSAIREIFKLLANPEVISFAGGNPAPASFPVADIEQITQRVLEQQGASVLQYGSTEGYPPLVQALPDWLARFGVCATAETMLVVSGAQQGIDLISKAMLDPGDVVLAESPTFLGALQIFATYQADVRPLASDEEGVLSEDLEEKIKTLRPKFVYLIPTFQNPTGKTLGLARRQRIVEIAARYNTLILEDDPYRDLRYAGQELPSMKSLDRDGNVVYLSSFSKVISPGLRCGVAVAQADILRKMVIGMQATSVHANNLGQAIVHGYLTSGKMPEHLAQIRALYKIQLDTMLGAIEAHFPREVFYTRPEGGLFVWAELPEGMDAGEILKKSSARNVAFVPGTSFFPQGGHTNTMRLNFSASTPERIERGIEILADVIKNA